MTPGITYTLFILYRPWPLGLRAVAQLSCCTRAGFGLTVRMWTSHLLSIEAVDRPFEGPIINRAVTAKLRLQKVETRDWPTVFRDMALSLPLSSGNTTEYVVGECPRLVGA